MENNETTVVLVKDINIINNYSPGSYPDELTEFKGKLYFSANDDENGTEFWVSDGTADGTKLLADISPGISSGSYLQD